MYLCDAVQITLLAALQFSLPHDLMILPCLQVFCFDAAANKSIVKFSRANQLQLGIELGHRPSPTNLYQSSF